MFGRKKPPSPPPPLFELPPDIFVRGGLTSRTPHSGEVIDPLVQARGIDNGRKWFEVMALRGQTEDQWKAAADSLASAWDVYAVTVERVPGESRLMRVTERPAPKVRQPGEIVPWQARDRAPVREYMSELPVGEAANGYGPMVTNLVERHHVAAGVSRYGKTGWINATLGHLAAHPHIDIVYIDLKGGLDAARWLPRLAATASTPAEADVVMEMVEARIEKVAAEMLANGVSDAWNGTRPDGSPFLGELCHPLVVIFDEVHNLWSATENPADAARREATVERWCRTWTGSGLTAIVATQSLEVGALPSPIRNQMTVRMAFKTTSSIATRMILGDQAGDLTPDVDPAKIPGLPDGRGVVITYDDAAHEYGRFHVAYLPEDEAAQIAARYARFRDELPAPAQGQDDEQAPAAPVEMMPTPAPVEPAPATPTPAVTLPDDYVEYLAWRARQQNTATPKPPRPTAQNGPRRADVQPASEVSKPVPSRPTGPPKRPVSPPAIAPKRPTSPPVKPVAADWDDV